ncbi:glycosyltransferase [Chloroflexia bacterium SDU3-3]|nr:glycosyltransferase [Chloroflexia bacterium SDU3-3]
MALELLHRALLGMAALSALWLILCHALTWLYFARYRRAFPPNDYAPPVSLIKPTKGVDQDALANFRSFCEQDYPSEYEVLFCVEDPADPVVPIIQQVIAAYPQRSVRLVFSDRLDTRSVGKLKNMIAGLQHSRHQIVAFSDSDAHVPPHYLRSAVAALKDERVGLAFSGQSVSGARDWPAALEAVAVNELVLRIAPVCMLGMFDGAVATSMVLRKQAIVDGGGLEQLGRNISDEIPLSRVIQASGYRVHLLGEPVQITHAHDTFGGWWEHMHRWKVIIRHYWPLKSAIRDLLDMLLWWALAALALALVRGKHIPPALFLSGLALTLSCVSAVLVAALRTEGGLALRYLWAAPLYELCRLPLFIHSWATSEIMWRGRRFRINADCTTTIVERGEPLADLGGLPPR